MRGIAASLESQQTPFTKVVNWQPLHNLAVLALEGGTPGDLDFRFKMNRILRSTLKGAAKLAHLRAPMKAGLSFEGTLIVGLSTLQDLREEYGDYISDLSVEIRNSQQDFDNQKIAEIVADESGNAVPISGNATTKKKRITRISLPAIQKEEQKRNEIAALGRTLRRMEGARAVVDQTITEAQRSLGKRLAKAKSDFGSTDDLAKAGEWALIESRIRGEAYLPKVKEEVCGLSLEYFSEMEILSADYRRLADFIDRHKENSLWYAPQEARNSHGVLLPLTQRFESLCKKSISCKDSTLKSANRELKEALAWRWLIISHNSCQGPKGAKVELAPSLSVGYERKRAHDSHSPSPIKGDFRRKLQEAMESIASSRQPVEQSTQEYVKKEEVANFLEVVLSALKWQTASYATWDSNTNTFILKEGKPVFKGTVERFNEVFQAGDALYRGAAVPDLVFPGEGPDLSALLEDLQEASEPETLDHDVLAAEFAKHPDSFDKDGLAYFRSDIDLIDIREGQTFVCTTLNGVEYRAIVGESSGPAKTPKAKGKTAVRQAASSSGSEKKTKRERSAEGLKTEHPLEQENPLKVKGEPKSKALSDAEKTSLRKFFKLKEGLVPSEEWATMSAKEKASALKERSLPRWAVESVLRSPTNLQWIIEGKITKENANSTTSAPKAARTKNGAQALEAWQQLKASFKGTPLLKKPDTTKEKAFRKRFDQLVADYGEQPFFPKLREKPAQQGRASSQQRKNSFGDSNLLDMVRSMGEIAKAFRGV
jgi:hypothetical protein